MAPVCASCFTRIDAAVVGSAGALAAAGVGWQRILDAVRGTSRAARRRMTYDQTAEFLRAMGHDPAAVLGPRPGDRQPAARVEQQRVASRG